jgi:hypothetical protein
LAVSFILEDLFILSRINSICPIISFLGVWQQVIANKIANTTLLRQSKGKLFLSLKAGFAIIIKGQNRRAGIGEVGEQTSLFRGR